MPKILPTVGRVVHYFPGSTSGALGSARPAGEEPLAAIVAAVHSEQRVNLTVFGRDGIVHARQNVRLVQDGEELPTDSYCAWMQYQKGQAAKTRKP